MADINYNVLLEKLNLLIRSFEKALYEEDEAFMKNMETANLAGDDIRRYQHWEWPQGVGLFGLWKMYEITGDTHLKEILEKYYERQLATGLPAVNVNTTAPLLALTYLYERTGEKKYEEVLLGWAEYLMKNLPRTKEDGFQHITSDTVNHQELWDDTLFMTVLFLARMGKLFGNKEWKDEAVYQFMLHTKYLTDTKTGFWFHGWTFDGNHNFAGALWGRGNSWITMAIPELFDIVECEPPVKRMLKNSLERQIEALMSSQGENGMWHTVLDDRTSYVEASATCGFGYGILRAVSMGLVDKKYEECALRAIPPVLENIKEDGFLHQVSYGTPMGRETVSFYKEIPLKPMPYGQAMAILFLMQAYKMKG